MTDALFIPEPEGNPPVSGQGRDPRLKARGLLVRRLIDIVAMPGSRISPQERNMCGDLLLEMLAESDDELLELAARRVSTLTDAPKPVLRRLACAAIEISRVVLADSAALDQSDLIAIIREGQVAHCLVIAERNPVQEAVADALTDRDDPVISRVLLQNPFAQISHVAMDRITAASRVAPELIPPLLKRPELKTSQALVAFWWAPADARAQIFRRFAVERSLLLESAADIFALARENLQSDRVVARALNFIERRQRDRAAAEASRYGSLELAIEAAATQGFSVEFMRDLSAMAGIRTSTGARIFSDFGGEPLAVFCKAVGLKRRYLALLWRAMARPVNEPDPQSNWARTSFAYETLSTQKAQTVLRYWNWSLTQAASPGLLQASDAA